MMLTKWSWWLPLGLLIGFLALLFVPGMAGIAWSQWVVWALFLGFLASLVLTSWVGIAGHMVREWRKGRRAALVYGPLVMIILAIVIGWWVYVLAYLSR